MRRTTRSWDPGDGNPALAPLRRRSRWDLLPPGQANGEIRAKSIHGFLHGLAFVFSIRRHTGQIDKFD
jgi:hypothetical protein